MVTSGLVTTIAGSPYQSPGHDDGVGAFASFNHPLGVAMDPAGTFALVTDQSNNLLRRINLTSTFVSTVAGSLVGIPNSNYGHADGTGTIASFNNPAGVAMDASSKFAVIVSAERQVSSSVANC